MFEVGRMCVKIAGRDAGKKCVVVDVLDENNVLIDGETRRRKCNTKHLEPLNKTISIDAKAEHASIIDAFNKEGLSTRNTKAKEKTERPKKVRKQKVKQEKPKAEKKAAKTDAKKAKEEAKTEAKDEVPKAEENKEESAKE